ncbi:MAG: cation:dicarboxylase symporter family transporter [Deltaproteobacteria bacterium]|nr:cation:dicarboxylase symporter family transporter [Deltaproteobacteria bacterium]
MKRISLTQWIFIGLVGGFLMGVFTPQFVPIIKPFRDLFLQGIKCIIAPLIFSTIVTGIAGAGSFKQLGLMGARTLIYFEVVTTLALAVGLAAVNLLQPGSGLHIGGSLPEAAVKAAATKMSFGGFVEHLLPTNIADAVVRGDVLQIVILSTLFAFSVLAVGERARPMVALCESLADIMFKFTGFIMYLAPLGVGAALATSLAEHGWQVIVPLLKLVGSLYLALGAFLVFVLYPVCRLFKIPVIPFVRHVKDAVILAFATTSSESAYPMALAQLERFGVPRRISSFVLPMGYSFNLDGSTLYLAVASVFVAQAAGVQLTLSQQLLMMVTLMLTTKGVAAVPRASIVVLSGTLVAFNLPIEGVALILGVDAFMDMARTAVNLLGNCLATAVVARCEGIVLPGVQSAAGVLGTSAGPASAKMAPEYMSNMALDHELDALWNNTEVLTRELPYV